MILKKVIGTNLVSSVTLLRKNHVSFSSPFSPFSNNYNMGFFFREQRKRTGEEITLKWILSLTFPLKYLWASSTMLQFIQASTNNTQNMLKNYLMHVHVTTESVLLVLNWELLQRSRELKIPEIGYSNITKKKRWVNKWLSLCPNLCDVVWLDTKFKKYGKTLRCSKTTVKINEFLNRRVHLRKLFAK